MNIFGKFLGVENVKIRENFEKSGDPLQPLKIQNIDLLKMGVR